MVDDGVIVHVLLLIGDDTTRQTTLGTFSAEHLERVVAGDAVVQCDDIMVDPAAGLLLDVDVAQANILFVGLFHAVEIQASVVSYIGFNDLCGQEVTVV